MSQSAEHEVLNEHTLKSRDMNDINRFASHKQSRYRQGGDTEAHGLRAWLGSTCETNLSKCASCCNVSDEAWSLPCALRADIAVTFCLNMGLDVVKPLVADKCGLLLLPLGDVLAMKAELCSSNSCIEVTSS